MDNKRRSNENEKLNTSNKKTSPYRASNGAEPTNARHGNTKGYGTRPVKSTQPKKSTPNIIKLEQKTTENDRNRNIEKKRKAERIKKESFMRLVTLGAVLAVTVAVLFMTPLFAICEIRLEGNDTVSKEIINTKVGDLIGANLFGTSVSDIKERMSQIPQIGDVEVKKAIFPSRLELTITESIPAGYVACGKDMLVINSDLRIIDDASVFDIDKLPSISGISVSEYELNQALKIKSKEKEEILKEILKAFEAVGTTEYVKYVSIDDITSITFNYDNRLDVICGSRLQMERKIRMFAESIQTSTFDEASIGTIDLSVPGTATYNP